MHTTHTVDLETLDYAPPKDGLQSIYRRSVAVAGFFGIVSVVAFLLDSRAAMQAYLVGFLFFVGLTLGTLAWLLIWFMPGGRWGLSMRRIFEAGARNIPYAALAFVPILIGYKSIYPWAHPEAMQGSEHLKILSKGFLNFPGFLVRGLLYFAVFGLIVLLVNKYSKIQDKPYSGWLGTKLTALGAVGVLAYIWAMSFASIDWIMSLLPGWPSTMFPLIIVAGQGIAGMSVALIAASILVKYEPMNILMDDVVFHDNGKLLFANIMLWAYFSYSQWLIIWAGNLPEEIRFFLDRVKGAWGGVALFVALFHFAVPFAILLSQSLKKKPAKLALVAGWMIFMRFVDLFWIVAPTFNPDHINLGKVWMYPVIALAMGGIWAALFVRNLMSRPVIALYDPRLVEIYGEAHE